MTQRSKFLATTIVGTLVLLALHPAGPFGALLWPQPAADDPAPEGAQLPLFLLLFVAEAAVSAFGLAYLLFGWRTTRGILPHRPRLALAAHLSLAYLLMQWWPHGNLHMSVPFSFGSILAIDYAFHFPIMIATILILAALAAIAQGSAERRRATEAERETRAASEGA